MARILLRVADEESGDGTGLIDIVTLIILLVESLLAAILSQTILWDSDHISADIEDKTMANEEFGESDLRLIRGGLQVIPDAVILLVISQRAQIEVHAGGGFERTIDRCRRHNCQQSNKANNAILHFRLSQLI